MQEAKDLWKKIQERQGVNKWRPDLEEEYEDKEGNIYNKKTYTDLQRQGLIWEKQNSLCNFLYGLEENTLPAGLYCNLNLMKTPFSLMVISSFLSLLLIDKTILFPSIFITTHTDEHFNCEIYITLDRHPHPPGL